jgi:hypothetical protein
MLSSDFKKLIKFIDKNTIRDFIDDEEIINALE